VDGVAGDREVAGRLGGAGVRLGSQPHRARRLQHRPGGLFEAFTSIHLHRARPGAQLAGLPRTIFDDPGAEHFYDQIAWFTKGQKHRSVLTLEAGAGGHVNFVPELQGERTLDELSWRISDH